VDSRNLEIKQLPTGLTVTECVEQSPVDQQPAAARDHVAVAVLDHEGQTVSDGMLATPRTPAPWSTTPRVSDRQRATDASLLARLQIATERIRQLGNGVNADGQREILGLELVTTEDGAGSLGFLRGLVARGLLGIKPTPGTSSNTGSARPIWGAELSPRCRPRPLPP
jgi:hypothetical protein